MKKFTSLRLGQNIIHCSALLLISMVSLIAGEDPWDNQSNGAGNDYGYPLAGHPHDGGCNRPSPDGHGANGPGRLCGCIFSDGPDVFLKYDEIIQERWIESQGANGPSQQSQPLEHS